MIAPPLLQLTSISKSFDAVAALRDVSFDLQAGEVHALVGENGAGKSTLVKIISGAEIPDAGAIEIAGQSVTSSSPQLSRELGVAVIYQQPALFPDLSVAENIALRSERSRALGFVGWPNRRRVARRLLDDAGCDAHVDALAGSLSMPQQQLVEIAAALGANARILILDEPTASLSNREVENLFGLIDRLRSRGVGMIYISHRLEELQRVADRVTVLRDGRHVETGAMTDMTRERLIRLMVGREINAVYPVRTPTIGKVAIEIRNLSCAASGVRDVSVAVHAGEIVGLAGLVGSGRSELARTLFGLTPATSGQILLSGLAVQIKRAIRCDRPWCRVCSRRSPPARRHFRDERRREFHACDTSRNFHGRIDQSPPRARRECRLQQAARYQGGLVRQSRVHAIRRKSAKGRARTLACDKAHGPDS